MKLSDQRSFHFGLVDFHFSMNYEKTKSSTTIQRYLHKEIGGGMDGRFSLGWILKGWMSNSTNIPKGTELPFIIHQCRVENPIIWMAVAYRYNRWKGLIPSSSTEGNAKLLERSSGEYAWRYTWGKDILSGNHQLLDSNAGQKSILDAKEFPTKR